MNLTALLNTISTHLLQLQSVTGRAQDILDSIRIEMCSILGNVEHVSDFRDPARFAALRRW